MFEHWPLLSLEIWLPIVGGLCVLAAGESREKTARRLALAVSLVTVALTLPIYLGFDTTSIAMQFRERLLWIPVYHIYYDIGVDGISVALMMLTSYTSLIVILSSWRMIRKKVSQYLGAFLILQGLVVGVFCSLDAMLFYVFWEAMLIPMYIGIGIWGSANRSYAAIKFFLYTFFGSALMLVALLYMSIKAGSFYIPDFYALKLTLPEQVSIFLAFLLGFAVKVPMFPVHTWLPDAHTEAPAGGSVVLAALMLKIGAYGFLRFSLPITPDACRYLDHWMIALSLLAVVYIGFVAITQKDVKRLIAYSSIAHMGFVTLGCFMMYDIVQDTGNVKDAYMGLEGSMMQMISHAFSTGGLFIGFGILYERIHSRLIKDFGGIAKTMPIFAACYMVFALANVGLPGTSGFVGEFMVLLSTFKVSFWVTFAAATTLVLAASYTLWMYKRTFFGAVSSARVAELTDIDMLERAILGVLIVAVIALGIYPNVVLDLFHASVGHLVDLALRSKL